MDAAAGEAAYADAQKSSDKQEQDLDPEAFEDDGKNEFKGMDKKEKKKAKKSKPVRTLRLDRISSEISRLAERGVP